MVPPPEQNNHDEHHHQFELINSWTCAECNKPISASRPPVLNLDNCSCVEVGTMIKGLAQTSLDDRPGYAGQDHEYRSMTPPFHIPPASYASSSHSVSCPEGPEHEDVNLNVTYRQVPLENRTPSQSLKLTRMMHRSMGLDIGLIEMQNQHFSSSPDGLSVPMQRFLIDLENDHVSLTNEDALQPASLFLNHEPYPRSPTSMKVNKGSKKSMFSQQSKQSSGTGSGQESCISYRIDPLRGAGAQFDDRADRSDRYPQWMNDSAFDSPFEN